VSFANAAASALARSAACSSLFAGFIAPIGRASGEMSRLRIVTWLRSLVAEPLNALRLALAAAARR
jgi:hypothetical protein